MKIRRLGFVALSVAIAGLLAGCTGSDSYELFDRPATTKDELPALFGEEFDEYADFASRFSASHDGVDYYVLRDEDALPGAMLYCVAVAAEKPLIACSGSEGVTASGAGVPEVRLVPTDAQSGEGWIAISENLLVRER